MRKQLLLLPLLTLSLTLHAQDKWSGGYRLGLTHEETFSNSTNKTRNLSNQVFIAYRILKPLELEAGLQHTQARYNAYIPEEMMTGSYNTLSKVRAQVFNLSLAAKYFFLKQRSISLYVYGGGNSTMTYGHYETLRRGQHSELITDKYKLSNKISPLAALFAGLGINYNLTRSVYLNAQVAAIATTSYALADPITVQHLYNTDLSTQIGFVYRF